jgi:hypothetical protein
VLLILWKADNKAQFPSQTLLLRRLWIQFVYADNLIKLPHCLSKNSKQNSAEINTKQCHSIIIIFCLLSHRNKRLYKQQKYKLWNSERRNKGRVEDFSYWEAAGLALHSPRRPTRHKTGCRSIHALLRDLFHQLYLYSRRNLNVNSMYRNVEYCCSVTYVPSSTLSSASVLTSQRPVSAYIVTKTSRGVTQSLHHTTGIM